MRRLEGFRVKNTNIYTHWTFFVKLWAKKKTVKLNIEVMDNQNACYSLINCSNINGPQKKFLCYENPQTKLEQQEDDSERESNSEGTYSISVT